MKIELAGVFVPWTALASLPLFVGFGHLLKHTTQSGNFVLAGALAFAAAVSLAFLRVGALERARCQKLQRPRSEWKDQQHVGFGARLRAGDTELLSPVSGRACGLAVWRLHVPRRGHPPFLLGRGLITSSSEFDTDRGRIVAHGVPEMGEHDVIDLHANSPDELQPLARYLLGGNVQLPSDGVGTTESGDTSPTTTDAAPSPGGGISRGAIATSAIPPIPWQALRNQVLNGEPEMAIRQLAESIQATGVAVGESTLSVGAGICLFGTWQAADRSIRFDSKHQNGWHGILAIDDRALLTRGQRRQRNSGLTAAILITAIAVTLAVIW